LTDEASAVGGGVGVDGHAEHVDGDVMVIAHGSFLRRRFLSDMTEARTMTTKGDQIVRIVITTEMLLVDVVDLEAVP
jgi:hypothetical protein